MFSIVVFIFAGVVALSGYMSNSESPSNQPQAQDSKVRANAIDSKLKIHFSQLQDPGVRRGSIDAGQSFTTLSDLQLSVFQYGLSRFKNVDSVSGKMQGEPNSGLGPRYNALSCVSCHSQPAPGGSSPQMNTFPYVGANPQIEAANHDGATNQIPSFITNNGPVREARFKFFLNAAGELTTSPDGGVHDLFTITGRPDATNSVGISGARQNCIIPQPDFNHNMALHNVSFRIPTPVFGSGLIENISDNEIIAGRMANLASKHKLGISGMPNRNGNDGTITRFGWKAQNKSLLIFSGEAYNVEIGVTNELFPSERPEPGKNISPSCQFNKTPEDSTNFAATNTAKVASDVIGFSNFMRFLEQPKASTTIPGGAQSIANGRHLFENKVKCALCHTPTLSSTKSSSNGNSQIVSAHLWSDLLVHHMGSKLADGISQGDAGPDQFRTAPLWGLGQRIFFLHDGRTSNLLNAIEEHSSSGSEATAVIQLFNALSLNEKQDLLNFLRSL